MRILIVFFLIGSGVMLAQETVAPTNEPVGPRLGDNWDGYNFTNSIETGYRFTDVSGNQENYQSAVNFSDGVRLFGASLGINSRSGKGKLFDNLSFNAQGLGGDPYESSAFRVEKNRIYRYDGMWRSNLYVDPGLVTGGGAGVHQQSSEYLSQDHNLILFPESAVRVFFGYTRDTQYGTAISSEQLFDTPGQIFPLFSDLKRERNEYRIGSEFHWHHTVLNWTHAWADFKDDSTYNGSNVSPVGPGAAPPQTASILRTAPYHGTSPYWIVSLFHDTSRINVNGKFTYTSGEGAFVSTEGATLTNALVGNNRQIQTSGTGQRPIATGNTTVTFFLTPKLTVTNHTSLYNVRTEGYNSFVQFDNFTQDLQVLYFQSLGIRTFATSADVAYDLLPWASVIAGYQFSTRRINSVEDATVFGSPFSTPYSQRNDLHSGDFGFHLMPWKPLLISGQFEIGRASLPFTPKSDGDYHGIRTEVSYSAKRFRLATSIRDDRNATSVSLSAYAATTRNWTASGSWYGKPWLSLDASYSKLHIDTLGGIVFFANSAQLTNQSYYLSNLHTGSLGARLTPIKRLTMFLGGSFVQDTGDGRSQATNTNQGPPIPGFQAAQTFPVQYLSPIARLSVSVTDRIRWNAGYQLYNYTADFSSNLNFAARTAYTSLLWSF